MTMKIETLEAISSMGSKTTLVGGTMGGVGAFLLSNLVGLLGVLVALIGVWINLHFKNKAAILRSQAMSRDDARKDARLEMERAESLMRMELMKQTKTPVIPVIKEVAEEVGTDWGALDSELKP